MKQFFLVAVLSTALFAVCDTQIVMAQKHEYKVVFDLTSGDEADHQSLIRWLKAISKNNPAAQLEVVFYGQSLPMVTVGKSTLTEDVQELAKNKNISFRVCEMAMQRHKLTKSDLLPGVGTVPDGIAEIVQKQSMGWGYIKAGR